MGTSWEILLYLFYIKGGEKMYKEKAIYKITNLINKKIYIGQSVNPQERWIDHIQGYDTNQISLIHRAIEKYGKENFSFEVLGWFEDYNEKEKYYIQYYKCLAPYGYNIHVGGEEPPHYSGENNNFAKISNKTAEKVQKQLMNWDIPGKTIIKENHITKDIFRHINDGTSWHNENLSYPLRPTEKELNEIKADKVIKLLKETNLSQKEIGQIVGWNRSAITMINIGKNHPRDNITYPIRK